MAAERRLPTGAQDTSLPHQGSPKYPLKLFADRVILPSEVSHRIGEAVRDTLVRSVSATLTSTQATMDTSGPLNPPQRPLPYTLTMTSRRRSRVRKNFTDSARPKSLSRRSEERRVGKEC